MPKPEYSEFQKAFIRESVLYYVEENFPRPFSIRGDCAVDRCKALVELLKYVEGC